MSMSINNNKLNELKAQKNQLVMARSEQKIVSPSMHLKQSLNKRAEAIHSFCTERAFAAKV